ncbi:6367_t:CDS:2 [Dentiscutata erythropus]|uniref:6367_t:CDS:1 n=1 Tax=Dentiscutata erythropus TaxID=1348616 RepID=A0A9N9AWW5_9GLOM|nr:6367_t:CDS:2 [Dentiscutata erythropus]
MALKKFFNSLLSSRGVYSLIDPNRSQKETQSLTFRHIKLKLCFFFRDGSYSSFNYLSLFLSTVFQLPKSLIGILLSVMPFMGFISSTCWSILADKWDIHRKIMILCITCIILLFWSFPFSGKYFGFCGLFINFVLYSIFDGGVGPLMDNLSINILNRNGDITEFGRQRLYGTLSYGLSGAILGFLVDRFDSLYAMFFVFGFFMGMFLLVLQFIPWRDFKIDHHDELITDNIDLDQFGGMSNESSTQIVDTKIIETTPPPFMESFLKLITKPRLLLFLFVLLSTRTTKMATSTFLYVFLAEDLKADATILGLSTFIGIILEIFVFYYGEYVLEFTFPENQGFEYGLVKLASLEIITQVAPPRLRGTALGIFAAIESLSTVFYVRLKGLGQIVGGLFYGNFGAVKMFLYSSWIGILSIIIYIAGILWQRRHFDFS